MLNLLKVTLVFQNLNPSATLVCRITPDDEPEMTGSDGAGDDFIPWEIQGTQAAGQILQYSRITPVRNAIGTARGRPKIFKVIQNFELNLIIELFLSSNVLLRSIESKNYIFLKPPFDLMGLCLCLRICVNLTE